MSIFGSNIFQSAIQKSPWLCFISTSILRPSHWSVYSCQRTYSVQIIDPKTLNPLASFQASMATFMKSEESCTSYDEILLKHAESRPSSYGMESLITAYTADRNPKLLLLVSFLALVVTISCTRIYYLGQKSSCEESTDEDAKRSSRRNRKTNELTCFYGSSSHIERQFCATFLH